MAKRNKSGVSETANDRFKRGFGNWFWASLIVATFVHFGIFAFWPTLEAQGNELSDEAMETLIIPPEVEIPPPPEQIARPAMPVVSDAEIDDDITIAETTFEAQPLANLTPPPANAQAADAMGAPAYTPYDLPPRLLNMADVQRELQLRYPPMLRNSGIGGVVNVWFYIDKDGVVRDQKVNRSSGYPAFDAAALQVAQIARFVPAENRDQKVAVWVQMDVAFTIAK